MIYVLIFIFGTIIGSFLNVLIIRVNTGESLFWPGSRCLSCSKKLKWPELIPVVSFFIQKGRCRHCKSKISWQYPVVEALTGVVFTLVAYKFFNLQFSIYSLFVTGYWLLIFSLLIAISAYDIRHQIIPDLFVYLFIILSLFNFFGIWNAERIFTGLGMFAFFALLWLVSKGRWMGFGDAKLALGAGWLLGFENGILATFSSFWLGAAFAVFLLLFRGKDFTLKSRIPFGPFLSLGTFFAFLLGGQAWEFYLKIFN